MNILIAEDDTSLSVALEHILKKDGNTADCVYDGRDVLEYVHIGSYDLVLLDVMLPKLDGFSVVRQMRTEKVTTPVLESVFTKSKRLW